jgi:hypothetical protein
MIDDDECGLACGMRERFSEGVTMRSVDGLLWHVEPMLRNGRERKQLYNSRYRITASQTSTTIGNSNGVSFAVRS